MVLLCKIAVVLFCAALTSSQLSSDESKPDESTYATLRSVSSESNEAEDRVEGKSLIGTIESVKKVADVFARVGSKILPDKPLVPSSQEFGKPKMRAIQIIHSVKKDVEDFAKSKSSP